MAETVEPTASFSFTSGALIRGQMRRAMMSLGLDYKEEKGWLDSYFVVSGPQSKVGRFYAWAKSVAESA
jgi:hypothetical protein